MAPATLFQGIKFWLSAGVPMKKKFIEDIKARGGEIVRLEKQADMLIVDHMKKGNPVNSFSYSFIDRSIKNGVLEDSEDHRATHASLPPRPAGSVSQATKGTRTPFTSEDDRVLLDWVWGNTKNGGKDAGNAIFQQLGTINTRHTWQAWRDRYVKRYRNVPVKLKPVDARLPSPPPDEIVNSAETSDEQCLSGNGRTGRTPVERNRTATYPTDGPSTQSKKHIGATNGTPLESPQTPKRAKFDVKRSTSQEKSQENSTKSVRFAKEAGGAVSDLERSQSTYQTEYGAQVSPSQLTSETSQETEMQRDARIWRSILKGEKSHLEDYITASTLLASSHNIVNVEDENWKKAWKLFTEDHDWKKWQQWADYWTTIIRPIYETRKHRFEMELEKEIENGVVPVSSPRGLSVSQDVRLENQSALERRAGPGKFAANSDALIPQYEKHSDESEETMKSLRNGAELDSISSTNPRSSFKRKTIEETWDEMPKDPPSTLRLAAAARAALQYDLNNGAKGDPASPSSQRRTVKRKTVEETWDEIPDDPPSGSSLARASKRQRIEVAQPEIGDEEEKEGEDDEKSEEDIEIDSDRDGDEETTDEDSESPVAYPDLPPDSDDEAQQKPDKWHHSAFAVSNDQSQHASRESGANENLLDEEIQLPPIVSVHKRDTQQEVDAQIFAESSFRVSPELDEDEPELETPDSIAVSRDQPGSSPVETNGNTLGEFPISDHNEPERSYIKSTTPQSRSRSYSPELLPDTRSPPIPPQPPNLSSPVPEDLLSVRHTTNPTDVDDQSESQNSTESLDRWINHFLEQGVTWDTLLAALTSTSMNLVLADAVVMEMQAKGKDNIPGDMEGVWTSGDDDCLRSNNPRMAELVRIKHGDESMQQRRKFLEHASKAEMLL